MSDALVEVDRCVQTFLFSGEKATRMTGTTIDHQYAPRMTGFMALTKQ
jgi:hypothetical protein